MKKNIKIIIGALILIVILIVSIRFIYIDREKKKEEKDNVNTIIWNCIPRERSTQNNTKKEPSVDTVADFGFEDLTVNGITFGSRIEEAISIFGSDYVLVSKTSDVDGSISNEYTFNNNLTVTSKRGATYDAVDSMLFESSCILKTYRGISIGSSRSDILEVYPNKSILNNDDNYVVVGYPGDKDEYSSKGRIYFSMNGDTVEGIRYIHTYAE